jgi:hypothetical protein
MSHYPKRDWSKTWLHFFCGAIVGSIVGTALWLRSYRWLHSWNDTWWGALLFIGGGALAIGFLAALFLDDFWETFLEWFRWW